MSTTTVVAIYVLIWWVTLFAVLPFGWRSQHESGAFEPGTDPGAPAVHLVWRKLMYTTVIATAIFGVLYVAYTRNLIPFGFLERISQPPHS